MRRASVCIAIASAATLAACARTPAQRAPTTATSSGAAADEQRTHGLAFRLPRSWRRASADASGDAQWIGPDNTLFVVAAANAADLAAHRSNLASLRARATQSGWALADERAIEPLGEGAITFEGHVAEQHATLRLLTWAAVVDARLAVISCGFDSTVTATAQPQCESILRSIERTPRSTPATELTRATSLSALSILVPSSWTAAPQGSVQVFVSRDSGERQIALSLAISPADQRLATLDVAALRARLSAGGSRVSEGAARAINGVEGVDLVVEQPQLRRAAVSELVVFVWHQSRSVAASCMFRTADRAARAACTTATQSIRTQRSQP